MPLPFFFCKGKSWYVAKSKEIITMELQNELLHLAGGFWCTEEVFFRIDELLK
jgi:hypothetical protein